MGHLVTNTLARSFLHALLFRCPLLLYVRFGPSPDSCTAHKAVIRSPHQRLRVAAICLRASVLSQPPTKTGPLRNARLLEAHAMLWIDLALKRGFGRNWAFALLRR
jgi:hypothetical protein